MKIQAQDDSIVQIQNTSESLIKEMRLCELCLSYKKDALLSRPMLEIALENDQYCSIKFRLCTFCNHGYYTKPKYEISDQVAVRSIYKFQICRYCSSLNTICQNEGFLKDYSTCQKCQLKYYSLKSEFLKCPLCQYVQCKECDGVVQICNRKFDSIYHCQKCKQRRDSQQFWKTLLCIILTLIVTPLLGLFYVINQILKDRHNVVMILFYGLYCYLRYLLRNIVILLYSLILLMIGRSVKEQLASLNE